MYSTSVMHLYVRGCSPEHFLFTRAFLTRSFASPRGLDKEVFLACSLHSVLSHIVALDSSRSRSALLCYARAPLLISRPAPSASSPPATLVYMYNTRTSTVCTVRLFVGLLNLEYMYSVPAGEGH